MDVEIDKKQFERPIYHQHVKFKSAIITINKAESPYVIVCGVCTIFNCLIQC